MVICLGKDNTLRFVAVQKFLKMHILMFNQPCLQWVCHDLTLEVWQNLSQFPFGIQRCTNVYVVESYGYFKIWTFTDVGTIVNSQRIGHAFVVTTNQKHITNYMSIPSCLYHLI